MKKKGINMSKSTFVLSADTKFTNFYDTTFQGNIWQNKLGNFTNFIMSFLAVPIHLLF